MLNPSLDDLMPYPVERLAALLDGVAPRVDVEPILMSLGEPQHAPPGLVGETLAENADNWGRYPPLRGSPGCAGF